MTFDHIFPDIFQKYPLFLQEHLFAKFSTGPLKSTFILNAKHFVYYLYFLFFYVRHSHDSLIY